MAEKIAELEKDSQKNKMRSNLLEQDLKEIQASLSDAEDKLKAQVAEFKKEREKLDKEYATAVNNNNFSEKEIPRLRRVVRDLENENKRAVEEHKKMSMLLANSERLIKSKTEKINQDNVRLKEKLETAKEENQELDKKIITLKLQVANNENINRRLMVDLEKEQAELSLMNKKLKKESLRNRYEREHYEEQLKFNRADKAIYEVQVEEAKARALAAETKLDKVKGDLDDAETQNLFNETQVAKLEEDKKKLEKKLLQYIERIVVSENDKGGNYDRDGDVALNHMSKRQKRRLTKAQIAEKKLKMHYNLALVYDKRKMYREEEKEYRKCLSINPRDANVHYNLAILYDDKLNKNKKAIAHYKKYMQLSTTKEEIDRVKRWMLHAEQEQRLGK